MSRFFIRKETSRGMSAALRSASDFCIPSIDAMERQGRPFNSRELSARPCLWMETMVSHLFFFSRAVEGHGAERGSPVQIILSPLAVEQASKKESATKSCSVGETWNGVELLRSNTA